MSGVYMVMLDENPEHKTRAEIDAIESPEQYVQYYDTTNDEYLVYHLGEWRVWENHPGHA